MFVSVHIFSFSALWMLHTFTGLIVSFRFDSNNSNVAQKPACGKIVLRIYQLSPYNSCVLKSVRMCMCENDTLHLLGFAKLHILKCVHAREREGEGESMCQLVRSFIYIIGLAFLFHF